MMHQCVNQAHEPEERRFVKEQCKVEFHTKKRIPRLSAGGLTSSPIRFRRQSLWSSPRSNSVDMRETRCAARASRRRLSESLLVLSTSTTRLSRNLTKSSTVVTAPSGTWRWWKPNIAPYIGSKQWWDPRHQACLFENGAREEFLRNR